MTAGPAPGKDLAGISIYRLIKALILNMIRVCTKYICIYCLCNNTNLSNRDKFVILESRGWDTEQDTKFACPFDISMNKMGIE